MKKLCLYFVILSALLFSIFACGSNNSQCVQDCHENHPGYSKSRCEEMCSNSNDSGDTAPSWDDSSDTAPSWDDNSDPAEPEEPDDWGYEEPDDWGYDGYSAAYEYIQACVNAGHSEEDCKNWYFE